MYITDYIIYVYYAVLFRCYVMRGITTDNSNAKRAGKGLSIWYLISFLAAAILLLLYLLLNYFGLIPEDSVNAMLTSDVLSIFSTAMFFIVSVVGLIKARNLKIRNGILAFTFSALMFVIAESTWTFYNFVWSIDVPYPSIADVFYVLGSVALVVAIYFVTRGLTNKLINLEIVAIAALGSILLGGLIFLISGVLTGNPIDSSIVLDIAYPVIDFITLVLVINLMLVSLGRSVGEAQVILAAGVIVTAVSDILFSLMTALGLYGGGSLLDFLFAIGYLLFAISVWRYVDLTRADILKDRMDNLKRKMSV